MLHFTTNNPEISGPTAAATPEAEMPVTAVKHTGRKAKLTQNMRDLIARAKASAKYLTGYSGRSVAETLELLRGHQGKQKFISFEKSQLRPEYSQEERDCRRAKADTTFRRGFLARLRNKEKKLRNPKVTSLVMVTAAAESYGERAKQIRQIEAIREEVTGKAVHIPLEKVSAGCLVSSFTAKLARKHQVDGINMSGADAQLIATRKNSHGVHESGETHWKNGKPVSYTRATHDNYVRSFGLIIDSQTLCYAFHTTEVRVILPYGTHWDVDNNGLRAVKGGDDYHVEARDLLATDPVPGILAKIAVNAEIREKYRTAAAVERSQNDGIFVCLADSLCGGNCRAGSLAFAATHGLDPHKHFSAAELMDIAASDGKRVRIAIAAARLRTQREISQGYSMLADHYVSIN